MRSRDTVGLALATISLSTKFDVSISTRHVDMTGDVENKVVWGSYRSLKVTGSSANR